MKASEARKITEQNSNTIIQTVVELLNIRIKDAAQQGAYSITISNSDKALLDIPYPVRSSLVRYLEDEGYKVTVQSSDPRDTKDTGSIWISWTGK